MALLVAGFTAAPAAAAGPPGAALADDLASCAVLEAPAERLACYDGVAGRAKSSDAAASAPEAGRAPEVAAPAPTRGPAAVEMRADPVQGSGLLSRFWELDAQDKRGTFNFVGYRPNYFLPLHVTSRLNSRPQSPTRAATELAKYDEVEAKLQISLRTKLIEGMLLPDADLWFGYTQQSLWQLWNSAQSSPFRSTDYEPELIYVAPVRGRLGELPFGWRWRMLQLGLVHQSNGQAKPLSRSWNRVYLGAGFERGDVSLLARAWKRLPEDEDRDDNPDLVEYRGRGDLQLSWTPGPATAALTWRSNFESLDRGSLQFDWSYPVYADRPNGLRWYLQVFSGYGETLLDYNFRQTSIGAGLSLFNF